MVGYLGSTNIWSRRDHAFLLTRDGVPSGFADLGDFEALWRPLRNDFTGFNEFS